MDGANLPPIRPPRVVAASRAVVSACLGRTVNSPGRSVMARATYSADASATDDGGTP